MKRSRAKRHPEPINIHHIYGPNSKIKHEKNRKYSDCIVEHVTGVHSGNSVCWWHRNNGNKEWGLKQAVIEWANVFRENGMET
jgi:hypothetical protein